jgi:uncharacterized membrane protein
MAIDYICPQKTKQLYMFGRLHPLMVHLPIGIIVLAIAMSWLSLGRRRALQSGLPVVWILAALSATAACVSGWVLARSGMELEAGILNRHQWLNIGLAVVTSLIALGYVSTLLGLKSGAKLTLVPVVLLYMGTMSGTALTHGEHFLMGDPSELAEAEGPLSAADVPVEPAPAPSAAAVQALRNKGVVVMPVAKGSHWLSVNCVNHPAFSDADLALIAPLAPNVVWLRLSDTQVSDAVFATLATMPWLSRIWLDGTHVSGAQLGQLTALTRLSYLNLSNTPLVPAHLQQLSGVSSLKQLFLRKTAVSGQVLPQLSQVRLDTGGYRLDFLPTDTARLKAKKSY